MKNTCLKLTLYFLGWLALFGVAKTDAWRDVWAQERGATPEQIQAARERWDALSPVEQAQLRQRFESLQRLDSKKRKELEERTKRHGEIAQRVLDQLSDSDRQRLKRLSREQRRDVMSELIDQERRDKGRRIESKLPNSMRKRLKNATPEEREKRLDAFKAETRERISARAVDDLAKALGYGEAELRRLERLSIDERMATVIRLRKNLTAQEVKQHGLPKGLTQKRWDALKEKPPEKFLQEIRQLQNQGVLSGVFDFETDRGQDSKRRGRYFARAVRRGLRVAPAELVGMSGLSNKERRVRTMKIRRTQVMAALSGSDLLAPEELTRLKALDDVELLMQAKTMAYERLARDPGKRPRKADRQKPAEAKQ